jgi:UDP-N-acetylmuramoyl-tripeptide--D-alanyl-D-alanine ligase
MMRLMEAALATGGTLLNGDAEFAGVSTDSRAVAPGELFVALRGERFDGHQFIDAAAQRGIAGAMVEFAWAEQYRGSLPVLAVVDTRLALGSLAGDWRRRFPLPLIGITGSNGKTTVKEMCAAILHAQAEIDRLDPALTVLATQGNLNNDIGVPLMLLRLRRSHCCAVIEMGMNHPGEISYLTDLARPTVALVTNAQRAHLQGLGSVAEVAREKGTIYRGLADTGVAVINADDAFADYWRGINGGRRVLSFGMDRPADVHGEAVQQGLGSTLRLRTTQGEADIALRVPGAHNVRNALAAAAATLASGAALEAVARGLAGYAGVKGRLQIRKAQREAMLLDDTYNANPDSVRAAIDVLTSTPGRKILVFGDMGETGERAGQLHDEIGGYAKSQGVDLLFALGEHAELAARNFGDGGRHFDRIEDLVSALRSELRAETTVLVKGSRFMRMERVADAISAAEQ